MVRLPLRQRRRRRRHLRGDRLLEETGASGYGNRYPSRDGAEERALQECGPGCEVVMWVRDECAALVIGKGNGYGTNRGTDENEAVQGAIAQCEQYTTDSGQIVMTCSAY